MDGPTRQAFVTEMVGARDVANAVGLNSAVFNAARIVGPAIAAALIVGVDIAWAFVLNGVSYLAVIGGLLAMDPAALHRRRPVGRARGQLREALSFAWRMPDLRATLVTVAVVATWGLNLSVVVPMLATFTFDGDATDYAILSSIAAVGALLGALATAGRARPTHRLLYGTAATFGVFGILAALAPTLMSAAALLLVAAAAAMSFIATANATIQLRTPDALRGRVMALYMLVFLGGSPVGAPVIGWIGERFGARAGLAFGAAVSLAAALVGLAVHERARRARSHALEPVASEA